MPRRPLSSFRSSTAAARTPRAAQLRRAAGELAARPLTLPIAVAAAAGSFLVWQAVRVGDWAVMTDELLYTKLATAIADTGSPVPSVHGEYVGSLAQLYPLLLAPLYAVFDVPTAFRLAHALNGILMASAAIPIYLLAREVLSRVWAAAIALAGVVTPWAVLAGFLMTEAAAYPAFVWSTLAIQRALVRPGRRTDALALVAVGVAFLARTQLLVLALVLPLAIVAHEVGYAAATGGRGRALLDAARVTAARHRLLTAAYGLGAAVAILVAAAGSLGDVLGSYAVTVTEGPLLPAGVWKEAIVHLQAVALGIGVAPLLLAAAWTLGTVVRPAGKRAHALAVVVVVVTASLSLQAASYDLRFGETDLVRDRYLFYVAPLLLVAGVAAVLDPKPRLLLLAGAAVAFAATIRWYDFDVVSPFTVDSPISLLNERIVEYAGTLKPESFVALVALLLAGALAAARSVVPREAVAGASVALVLVLGAVTAHDAFERVLASTGPSGRLPRSTPGETESWIDEALPDGADAAIVPFPVTSAWETSAVRWWDVEFWNRSVKRAFVSAGGTFSYTPFPVAELGVDPVRGRVHFAGGEPSYLVVATQDIRFRLAGPRRAAREGLELIEAERPYRAEWVTYGLDVDGWLRPRRPATLRAFARPGAVAEVVTLDVVLKAPLTEEVRYRVETKAGSRSAAAPADAAVVERLELCVRARGHADAQIAADATAVIPGPALGPGASPPREVAARIESITVARTGNPCEA